MLTPGGQSFLLRQSSSHTAHRIAVKQPSVSMHPVADDEGARANTGRRIHSHRTGYRPEISEVAVYIHTLAQDAHDIDDALGGDPVVQGV
jgi:hypothetical protein